MTTMVEMDRRLEKRFILIFIVFLAGFLRFYQLGVNPPSLDWDETSLGYNAWSLMQTGHDEFGNSWPLSIRSFGDYKPPLYTYMLIPSLKIFGKSEFAIRFPSALAGTLTVLVTYFLVLELFSTVQPTWAKGPSTFDRNHLALLSSFLLTISPWHLQFSRIAFEANLGLFFFVAGMWQFVKWLKGSGWSIFFVSLSFSLALMSYHSLRLVIPLILIADFIMYRNRIIQLISGSKFIVCISAIPAIATVLAISYTVFIQKVGQARFSETSIFTITKLLDTPKSRVERFNGNLLDRVVNQRYLIYAKQYISGYLDHYNLRFWLLDGDRIDRHRAPDVGLLYFWEFPFLAIGLFYALKLSLGFRGPFDRFDGLTTGFAQGKKSAQILIFWFLLAPAASAATGGTPSAVRSLVFLPTFQIFTAIGVVGVFGRVLELRRESLWKFLPFTFYLLPVTFEIARYFHQYYVHAPVEYATAWQYGYKQAVEQVLIGKETYDQIIMTTSYDQPYIYFLWYGNYDPGKWINGGAYNKGFDKFQFMKIEWQEMKMIPHALIVGTAKETGGASSAWEILYPNRTPAFVAVGTQ